MSELSFNDTEIAFKSQTNKQLKKAYFLFSSMNKPWLASFGLKALSLATKWKMPIKPLIKYTIFEHFCGGEKLEDTIPLAKKLKEYNVGIALDYGVEGMSNEAAYDAAVPEFIKAIEFAATQTNIPFIPIKVTGFCRFGLLEKLHNKETLEDREQMEWLKVVDRINIICKAAQQHKLMILVDAEESYIQNPVDDLANQMMEKYNKESVTVFNTFQMYRHDRLAFLKKSHSHAIENNYLLGAKIVRGAYMEKERLRAQEMNYPSPIQVTKENTDKDYNEAVAFCIDYLNEISLFIGTHNEESCFKAAQLMKQKGISFNHHNVHFSQLLGMSDNITFNLANAGYNTSKYVPYGPVEDVMPYLIRRAQENSSVAGQSSREFNLIRREIKRRKM